MHTACLTVPFIPRRIINFVELKKKKTNLQTVKAEDKAFLNLSELTSEQVLQKTRKKRNYKCTAFSIDTVGENGRGRTHYFHPSENSVKPQFQAPQGFVLVKGLSGDVCTCKVISLAT